MNRTEKIRAAAEHLFALGTALFLLLFLRNPFAHRGTRLLPELGLTHDLVNGAGLLLFGALWIILRRPGSSSLPAFTVGLLAALLTDFVGGGYTLLHSELMRGEVLALTALLLLLRRKIPWLLPVSVVLICFSLSWALIVQGDGRPLSTDDHNTFFYRLALLQENFPFIPFYGPMWNAGIDARDFFATGALNVFFLFSPIIYFTDLNESYPFLIAMLCFGLLPLFSAAAARLEGASPLGQSLAALLALSSSFVWYRWAFSFGTLGFITSSALIPMNVALASRWLDRDQLPSGKLTLLTFFTVSLMLLWTPTGLIFIPIIVLSLFHLPRLLGRKRFLALTAALILFHLPWMTLFWSASNVSRFLEVDQKTDVEAVVEPEITVALDPQSAERSFRGDIDRFGFEESVETLQEAAHAANPVLLFFLLPALLTLRRRHRLPWGITLLGLLFGGAVLSPLKPQLELDRLLLVFFLLSATPVAVSLDRFFRESKGSLPASLLCCFTLGTVLTGAVSIASIVQQRSLIPISFRSDQPQIMADALNRFGGDGRVLFSGFILHEMDGGHFAPLALKVKTPLLGISPVHDRWWYQQIFPEWVLEKGEAGVREYLDLYNVTAVWAHEPIWRRYFRRQDSEYQEVFRHGSFVLFDRIAYDDTYFLEGEGEVLEQTSSTVRLRVDGSSAVLKFHWYPFVAAEGCSIEGVEAAQEITFIKLTECTPGSEVRLRSIPPWDRLRKAVSSMRSGGV